MNFPRVYRLVRMEWMKLSSRLNIVFTSITLSLIGLQVAFVVQVELGEAAATASAAMVYGLAARYVNNFAFTFIPILFLVNLSKEFGYAVVHRALVSGLSRNDYFFSKLLQLAAFSAFALLTAIVFTMLTALLYSIPLLWECKNLLMYFPVAFTLGSFSFLLVLLLKKSLYSLTAFLLYVLSENLLTTIVPGLRLAQFLPFQCCARVLRHDIYEPMDVAITVAYGIVFLVLSYWRFLRMDLR